MWAAKGVRVRNRLGPPGFALAILLARICVTDCIQNSLCPVLIIRTDDNHSKAVLLSLHLHAFGIINVKIYTKGRRILRGQT